MIGQTAKNFTQILYKTYGVGGYLFGIAPDKREAVETIIQATIDICKFEFRVGGIPYDLLLGMAKKRTED